MKFNNIKSIPWFASRTLLGGTALLLSHVAHALNYFELEVYPYHTADQGEVELENFTTYTRRGTQTHRCQTTIKGWSAAPWR